MRLFIILCMFFVIFTSSAQITGAWTLNGTGDDGEMAVLILSENYLSIAVYNQKTQDFIRTYGGAYTTSPDQILLTLEYDTKDTSLIGQKINYTYQLDKEILSLHHTITAKWQRIPESKTPLNGCWRITDRLNQDGNMSSMPQGDRKTMKMMSGSRFQWFAINPKTKQFSGTGGGSYTLKDGKYIEKIEFFSRDKSRVGNSLEFEASVDGNKWNHKGKSSTGNAVHEIWTKQ